MNDLAAVQAFLSAAMQTDARLSLAQVVAWLDPVYLVNDGDALSSMDDENDVPYALHVCRQCFPAVYGGAVQLLRQGSDEVAVRRYMCDGMNQGLLTKLDDLEQVRYGVPVEGMGLCLEDGEFCDIYPDLAAIVADFGLYAETDYTDYQTARHIASLLVESLSGLSSATLNHLAQLLTWLFALSGNTLVDMTMEDIWESGMEMPDWSPENIAFVNAMTREAQHIIDEATMGEKALHDDPALHTALRKNIQRVRRMLSRTKRSKSNHDRSVIHLDWPERP
ncbi:MAG: hypothetical protein IT324_06865 [Anaerolineae bacterium]|nr:hypothetical protein [Anaerolineae bacterium]